jgi:hypothetical protein
MTPPVIKVEGHAQSTVLSTFFLDLPRVTAVVRHQKPCRNPQKTPVVPVSHTGAASNHRLLIPSPIIRSTRIRPYQVTPVADLAQLAHRRDEIPPTLVDPRHRPSFVKSRQSYTSTNNSRTTETSKAVVGCILHDSVVMIIILKPVTTCCKTEKHNLI